MTIVDIEPAGDDLAALIADAASGIFARIGAVGSSAARSAADAGAWYDEGWQMLVEAGFIPALRSAQEGGVGAAAALLIVRLAAAAGVALPLAEAMGADWLLAKAGLPPSGVPTVFAPTPLALERTERGIRIAARLTAAPWARACDLVAIGRLGGGSVLARLPSGSFSVLPASNVADEPRDEVHVDQLVDEHSLARLPPQIDGETLWRLGAVLRSAQLAGAAEATVQMAVDYARNRQQFGRALSQFQAVQQLLAIIAGEAAAARVAADLAARALDGGLGLEAVAAAKIRSSEAAGKIAAAAHQIHGAIGFTRDYALQLFTRRLWSWRDEFGSEAEWSAALGRALASRQQPLWPAITDIEP